MAPTYKTAQPPLFVSGPYASRVASKLQAVYFGCQEVYPLWALSTVASGGLDWTSKQIGQVTKLQLPLTGTPYILKYAYRFRLKPYRFFTGLFVGHVYGRSVSF